MRRNTLGAYFPDLPSNMLGSFCMGLLAAASTLNLSSNKAIAILPANSRYQVRRTLWHAAPGLEEV